MPTDSEQLASGLQSVGIQDFKLIPPVGNLVGTANQPSELPTGARREWRIKKETGELRGVVYRERNKERKTIGWINHDSPGFPAILEEYERWRRVGKYVVGTPVVANNDLGGTG